MEQTLSYVLVTPYTIAKSRTGGVLARLISRAELELVGSQMIAADETLTKEFANHLRLQNPNNAVTLLADYVEQNLGPSGGRKHRALLLLFRGENPCGKLAAICGHMHPEHQDVDDVTGETIRDTYADLISDPEDPNKVTYFEPAVITPRNQEWADKDLALFSRHLKGKENIIRNIQYTDPTKIEQTLVIIKPDNWQYASSKPGTIIDMFSRTGLRIIGIKVHRFSLAEALDFYGPVEQALREKLAPLFGKKAREVLEKDFNIQLSEDVEKGLTESFGVSYAKDQFDQIIEFMSGTRTGKCPPDEISHPGVVKCMILFYEGENAVKKIRDVLGPTDPLKAPGGTVRREFGSNVMVNTAHASDSAESVEREKAIIKYNENTLASIIDAYLGVRK
ncbi:nucleoside diphosphate kinase family [Treponema primitia ZAS-2]|uniref:nucleoside-diphosphate kinase n=1 Tax=Treponema primitia (strain ATCC BAA-887 / DSM 12427 / ZAS-2) TaxID=545694 RepID=F5YQI7_TREPZ|nr:nucleoside-diphosphate kinase [Treponema primitia]AEF86046.1 nucleoside diphosphate kinase family [Treponema primitia ZAS-2]